MGNKKKFFEKGFNLNKGYSIQKWFYKYEGKSHIGYVLVKNYVLFWIPGYDIVDIFTDEESLNEYILDNKIKLS